MKDKSSNRTRSFYYIDPLPLIYFAIMLALVLIARTNTWAGSFLRDFARSLNP